MSRKSYMPSPKRRTTPKRTQGFRKRRRAARGESVGWLARLIGRFF